MLTNEEPTANQTAVVKKSSVDQTQKTKKKKQKKSKRLTGHVIWVVVSRKFKTKRSIEKALKKIDHRNVDFVVIAQSTPQDQLGVQAARKCLFNLVTCPANYIRYGSVAEAYRTEFIVRYFKPRTLLLFCKDLEEDQLANLCAKHAKRKEIEVIQVKK